jgi:hypothetical protein
MINPCRARNVIHLILLAGLIGAPGCASTRPTIPEALLAETSTIGVVVRPTDPDVELQIPRKGWLSNTGRGAMSGSVIGGLGIYCYYAFFVCVPALATVGAIGGAIYGAVAAEPASEWEQAESAFKEILPDLKIKQRVPDHVVDFARSQTPYRVIRVETEDPSSKDEKTEYRALASKGIDAVLELTELAVHLRPSGIVVNPPRILMMDARARLIRTSDGALLDDRVITDDTLIGADSNVARSLTTWADQNAQVFREEVTQAAQRLAQQVVKELFSDNHSPNDVQIPVSQAFSR